MKSWLVWARVWSFDPFLAFGRLDLAVGIATTREDERAAASRRMARLCRTVAQAWRLLAVALVMGGHSRTDAATAGGMDRRSLRDWVHRFDVEGPAGLVDEARSGCPSRLSAEPLKEMDAVVEAGPDVEVDGVMRWRCVDLQRVIAEKYKAEPCERSVSRMVKDRGLRHVSVRPQHPRSDSGAQGLFKEASPLS